MRQSVLLTLVLFLMSATSGLGQDEPVVTYEKEIAPLLRKYCAGCHNDEDREAEFSAESYASMQKGLEEGPAFLEGDAASSRIYRLMTGKDEPKMPPEDEPAPSEEEIELVRRWIDQGGKGPDGAEPNRMTLHTPEIETLTDRRPVTAIDWSPNGDAIAVAKYGEVTMSRQFRTRDVVTGERKRDWHKTATLKDFPGKVNSAHFVLGGSKLLTASGVSGLGGIATLWEWPLARKVRDFEGHRDIMYDAEVSPDGTILATSSYDRTIILWNLKTGEQLRTLAGHNGAVYDIEFSPDGHVLASASADATCKLWRVSDGVRLDTLGQPLEEQYSVAFSPNGRFIAAGGADNRIRVWRFVSTKSPKINPLVYARFAHEGPIARLAYTPDGKSLISISEDRTMKVWETRTYTETQLFESETEVAMSLAVHPESNQFMVGRLDGTTETFAIKKSKRQQSNNSTQQVAIRPAMIAPAELNMVEEAEPNQTPQEAQQIQIPATVSGRIGHEESEQTDVDCFQFHAQAGEEWVFEVNAARSKSPLDSFVEVLTADGKPIERVVLQAVRDSYFTFRGKTADQSNDFRLFNWEEMELNEYLYANGEVVKLWLYPRGPDSGFNVYPGTGNRWGYFDTTPLSHALGEPCYVVEPHAPGAHLIPNGLPVFPLYYQNDDESRRKLGKDSKLYFTTPATGDYVVRVRDVRGMAGKEFTYKLTARPRKEDFQVSLVDKKITVAADGSREFRVKADRLDNFDGPIEVSIHGLPEGYETSLPVIIEEGQVEAVAVISTGSDAKTLKKDELDEIALTAAATIHGEQKSHAVKGFDEIKIDEKPKLHIAIAPAEGGAVPLQQNEEGLLEFEIHPGETIMLEVQAERLNHGGEISFGKEDAGRNLPHGLIVDNIGLNGLLMLSDQSQREFFITAAKWVPPQTRKFHLRTTSAGSHATKPILLHVRPRDTENEGLSRSN